MAQLGARMRPASSAPCARLPGQCPSSCPSLVHDDKGNTLYEEPSIAWMHIRVAQVRTGSLS